MKKGLIIILSGPAGSGKGTVIKQLTSREDFVLSVSRTTRKPRPGETEGKDYYFITNEEFDRCLEQNDFLEHAEYCSNRYGTPKKAAEQIIAQGKNLLLEIEVDGAMQVKRRIPDAVLIMLLPPSFRIQEERLRGRATETDEIIEKRLCRTREELQYEKYYDYIVHNPDNNVSAAAEDIISIVKAENLSVKRNPDAVQRYFE